MHDQRLTVNWFTVDMFSGSASKLAADKTDHAPDTGWTSSLIKPRSRDVGAHRTS